MLLLQTRLLLRSSRSTRRSSCKGYKSHKLFATASQILETFSRCGCRCTLKTLTTLEHVSNVHRQHDGGTHAGLVRISQMFDAISEDRRQHMQQMSSQHCKYSCSVFSSVANASATTVLSVFCGCHTQGGCTYEIQAVAELYG